MKQTRLLYAIGNINEAFIAEAAPGQATKETRKRPFLFVAAALLALTLCGFTAYQFGWFDPWLQKPSVDPRVTVQCAIENQVGKDYTIRVQVDEIKIDDDETARIVAMYSGSELAESRGWTNQYLAEHFVVVSAKYYVEYDHTKTFLDDGYTQQYFYLAQDTKTGTWTILDNTAPNTSTAPPTPLP